MKRVFLLCMLIAHLTSFSQTTKVPPASYEPVQIDPRQYVNVLYKKNPAHELFDTIWNWELRKNVPSQKRSKLDVDGELKITFDLGNLIKNEEFEGNISLEAEITGKDGLRKIEVSPYSEVGLQRQEIGYESEPPGEIARKFLNMILALKDIKQINSVISGSGYLYDTAVFFEKYLDPREFAGIKTYIDSLTEINKNKPIQQEDHQYLLSYILHWKAAIEDKMPQYPQLSTLFRSMKTDFDAFLEVPTRKTYNNLLTFYTTFRDRVNDINARRLRTDNQASLNTLITNVGLLKNLTRVVASYLNSFTLKNNDARKAFFSLINTDTIAYAQLSNIIKTGADTLEKINVNGQPDSAFVKIFENIRLLRQLSAQLTQLSNIDGSKLNDLIGRIYIKSDSDSVKQKSRALEFYSLPVSNPQSPERDRIIFETIREHYDELTRDLCIEAGKTIYKRLVYATIDLGKSGAKAGEVMHLYVTWKFNQPGSTTTIPPRVNIGKYYIRETGWNVEISDVFAMVERLGESHDQSGTVSPSNFKGAGGAVLMLTYYGEDRGVKITPHINGQDTAYSLQKKSRLLNALQPSFGINVSYLDFSTAKDVEIGTGFQLGLFRNKLFFGMGCNLHMIRKTDSAPLYFFLGFSFAKLQDLFKPNQAKGVSD
ncbi:hypothetical protein LZZ85_00935 [Terrimonas sp. NA20]|uniref:Uncharacterized protein n=1 Tax=Terrimonas ginsenosidimutans TaxID=2908004 RepID=A0ABS9KKH4_9BACT|nr:hypothetical protein [Terrimonas ginsenosidimutans]MCG2612816.1 hypothetical protein [Terrimonas ginsenosidimutans]